MGIASRVGCLVPVVWNCDPCLTPVLPSLCIQKWFFLWMLDGFESPLPASPFPALSCFVSISLAFPTWNWLPFINHLLLHQCPIFIFEIDVFGGLFLNFHLNQYPDKLHFVFLLSVLVCQYGSAKQTSKLTQGCWAPILEVKIRRLNPYWYNLNPLLLEIFVPWFNNERFFVKLVASLVQNPSLVSLESNRTSTTPFLSITILSINDSFQIRLINLVSTDNVGEAPST